MLWMLLKYLNEQNLHIATFSKLFSFLLIYIDFVSHFHVHRMTASRFKDLRTYGSITMNCSLIWTMAQDFMMALLTSIMDPIS